MSSKLWTRVLFMVGFWAGCGGGSSSSPDAAPPSSPDAAPHLSSGVSASKPLNTLTPAEQQKLCEATAAFLQAAVTQQQQTALTCKIAGISAAQGSSSPAADCTKATNDCLAANPSTSSLPDGGASSCTLPASTCTATVGQYEACANDAPGALPRAAAALPDCTHVTATTNPEALLLPLLTAFPASCQQLTARCPDAVSGLTGL